MARNRTVGAVVLILTILGVAAAWLVVPEFRKWTGLDRPSLGGKSISGIVVDRDSNRGIGQASITVAGRTEQYVTEDSGNFAIELSPTSSSRVRLHVSKRGFQPLDTSVEPPVDSLVLQLRKE